MSDKHVIPTVRVNWCGAIAWGVLLAFLIAELVFAYQMIAKVFT